MDLEMRETGNWRYDLLRRATIPAVKNADMDTASMEIDRLLEDREELQEYHFVNGRANDAEKFNRLVDGEESIEGITFTGTLASYREVIDLKMDVRRYPHRHSDESPTEDGEGAPSTHMIPVARWVSGTFEEGDFELLVYQASGGRMFIVMGPHTPEVLQRLVWKIQAHCSSPSRRINFYSGGGWTSSDKTDREIGEVSWEDLILPGDQAEQVLESCKSFLSNEEAYKRLGISWKRGVLLVGPPGTGKTMLCKALSSTLDVPVLYVKDLTSMMSSPENVIEDIFDKARQVAPCLLIFEDIDGFVKTHANRAVLLNQMDGFESNDGVIVLASSNHPGEIDQALIKRPSRFDRVFHIGKPGYEERRRYTLSLISRENVAERFLDPEKVADEVAEASEDFTLPYIKEAFVSTAILRVEDDGYLDDELVECIERFKEDFAGLKDLDEMAEVDRKREAGFGKRSYSSRNRS